MPRDPCINCLFWAVCNDICEKKTHYYEKRCYMVNFVEHAIPLSIIMLTIFILIVF